MNNQKFVSILSELKPSSTFLSLRNYKNSSEEVADYSIVFNMSYEQAVKKSLQMITEYQPENKLEEQAKEQLIASYQKSLDKMEEQPMEAVKDGYQHFQNETGSFIKGVKLHLDSGNLHIYGLLNNKKVTTPGVYKDKNSSELTKAKNKLTKNLPVSKFRQFIVNSDKVDSIKVQKLTLLPVDE